MIDIKRNVLAVTLVAFAASWSTARGDIVHLDDVIANSSLCVGQDCVNGEIFGFLTIKLAENNLRIGFKDTSASAAFPTQDWVMVINESNNGGMDFFVIGQPFPLAADSNFPKFGGGNALNCPPSLCLVS